MKTSFLRTSAGNHEHPPRSPASPSSPYQSPTLARKLSEYGRTLRGSTLPARRKIVSRKFPQCAPPRDAPEVRQRKRSASIPRPAPLSFFSPLFHRFRQKIAAAPSAQ